MGRFESGELWDGHAEISPDYPNYSVWLEVVNNKELYIVTMKAGQKQAREELKWIAKLRRLGQEHEQDRPNRKWGIEVTGLLRREESAVYLEWKRSGHHWEEYASETLGTLFLVFCVVGIVAWMFGTLSPMPALIPSHLLRLLLAGLLLGGAGGIVALSPPGRLSGAHLNPAVSLGFWVLGKMEGRDLGGYVAGQMLGAGVGALLGRTVFGSLARSVQESILKPGPGVGTLATLLAEIGTTLLLTLLIFTCVSHAGLVRWTPVLAAGMVGLLVALDGSYSGCGMNPARWFGPALAAAYWPLWWAYVAGPLAGALLAAGLRRTGLLTEPVPQTGKLFHDAGYRSIFKHDRVPTTPPAFLPQDDPG